MLCKRQQLVESDYYRKIYSPCFQSHKLLSSGSILSLSLTLSFLRSLFVFDRSLDILKARVQLHHIYNLHAFVSVQYNINQTMTWILATFIITLIEIANFDVYTDNCLVKWGRFIILGVNRNCGEIFYLALPKKVLKYNSFLITICIVSFLYLKLKQLR